jgi:hypothetical protein
VQIHTAFSDQLDYLRTKGCFSIAQSEWPAFKQKLLEENAKTPGGLQLSVGRDGMASITARGKPDRDLVPAHASNPASSKRWSALGMPKSMPNVGSHPNFGHRGRMPNIGAALRGTGTDESRGALHGPALQAFRSSWGNEAFRARGKQHADLLGDAQHAGLVGDFESRSRCTVR